MHVDIYETIGDDFIKTFMAKTVDMTTSSWEEYFTALERYSDGDCSRSSSTMHKARPAKK